MDLRSLHAGALIAVMLVLCWPQASQAQQGQYDADLLGSPRHTWIEGAIGVGQLAFDNTSNAEAGTGLSVELIAGGRISRRWSVGLAIGAVGLKPSNQNYHPYDYGSSIWGESITHVGVLAQFQPRGDRGWFYGGGVGRSYYHNKPLEDLTGTTGGRIGQGGELMLRTGYDWPQGEHLHLQASLGVDTGHMSLDRPLSGSFQYTAVNAHISVALR